MDVQFKNPFYHGKLGLLSGAGDDDTIYVLSDTEVLPRTAVVVAGESVDRKKNEKRGAAASQAKADAEAETDDEEEEFEPAKPRRVKPQEGKSKGDNIPKKRK